jgi:choline-sulfatase
VLLLASVLACSVPPAEAPPDRIVLVTIDTLRADHVGSYRAAGQPPVHTPTLDGLAGDGVRFEVALSPAPLTLPSHSSLMTGLEPPRHGVRHNGVFRLPSDLPTIAERMSEAGYATAAFVGAFVLDSQFGLARGFDVYDDDMSDRRSAMVGFSERRAGDVVDAALAWLRRAPPRFFVWIHLYDAHANYDPPPGFALAFPGRPYDGEIAYVDSQIGRFLEELAGRFDPAGTLVVVTSDHGEALGEHGEAGHSYGIYEATQRIPLIARGPGFRGGRVVHSPVRLVDVGPTLVAAVGGPPLPGSDGRDLRALAGEGSRADAEPPAYHETLATRFDLGWSALFGLRTERWKYIRAPRPELYDLDTDPHELDNLAERRPELVAELDARLSQELADARPLGSGLLLSSDERARLEALGYAAPSLPAGEMDLGGPDPKDRVEVLDAINRAETASFRGRPDEAYAALAAVPADGPLLWGLRAAYAINAGDATTGEREARAALAGSPERSDFHMLLGQALEAQGRLDEAERAFERAAELDASASRPQAALGRIAEQRGDPEVAAKRYQKALAKSGSDAEAAWRLAALRFDAGDAEAARALLASHPDPPGLLPALRLALAERGAGDAEAAARHLASSLPARVPPQISEPVAQVLAAGGMPERARQVREAALAAAPDSWVHQNAVAWDLASRSVDLDRALDLARRAVAGSEQEPHTLDTLATVYLQRGETRQALAQAETALAAATDADLRAHILYVKAASLARESRPTEARRALEQSLELVPPGSDDWRPEAEALARDLGP